MMEDEMDSLPGAERLQDIARREATDQGRRRQAIRFDWATLSRGAPLPDGESPKNYEGICVEASGGRILRLQQMHQRYIYTGHLLGAMHHPEKSVLEAIEQAERLFPWMEKLPIVLPPELIPFHRPQSLFLRFEGQPDVGAVTLPRVCVIAEWESAPTNPRNGSFSSLLVIWFQESFGDPSPRALSQIAALDWDALAMDWTP